MQTNTTIGIGTWRTIFQIPLYGTPHLSKLATNLMMASGFKINLQKEIIL